MNKNFAKLRKFHRWLAPIMILPILLTLITGTIYQIGQGPRRKTTGLA